VRYTGQADIGFRNRYAGVHPYYFLAALLDPHMKAKLPQLMTNEQLDLLKKDLITFMMEVKKEQ
jgi:hypothetical protein